jgi:Na+-driven multidrug efflux pump
MLEWGLLAGAGAAVLVAAFHDQLPAIFTDDAEVRATTAEVLWVVAALQPVNAIVFVLDGILIGAGESRFLALAMVAATAVYLPVAWLVYASGAGLLALWCAIGVFMMARLAGMGGRYLSGAWVVTGATR